MVNKLISFFKIYLLDFYDSITGRRNSMIPPRHMVPINAGDSEEIGNKFLQHFILQGGLKNTDNVLDVGSGYGRMAVPLTSFLLPSSSYEGIEIMKKGVEWCQNKITPRYKNFNFQLIDVKNGRYNPGGSTKASEYKFPFEDETFDFVFLTSVFTHMLPKDLENYLSEIVSVMKKGGRCLITFFLIDEITDKLIEDGKAAYSVKYPYENCRIESKEDPEFVTAYTEADITALFEKYGLKIISINYGSWSGREKYLSRQDIVVGEKT